MQKRILVFLCVLSFIITMIAMPTAAATTTSKLVTTNIPKSFPIVKQDPSSTVVNFWHANSGNNAVALNNICNWYNATLGKKNKVYVKSIFQGDYAAITTKVAAVLQAGNLKDLPDVIQCAVDTAFLIKESKNVIYMEDLMNADKNFKIKDKLNKNCMYACSYKGKQLGLPMSNSVCVLHYNADAFRAAGLDPNNPPKTYTELMAATTKLMIKGSGKKPVRYGFAMKIGEWQLATLISRQNKGTATQFNNDEGHMATPTKYVCGTDGSLKALLTQYKKHVETGAYDYLDASPQANFRSGLDAMYFGTSVNYDSIVDYFNSITKDRDTKVFENRMAPMPLVNEDDAIGSSLGGAALFMFNKNDEKKKMAAWDFVKFMASTDVSTYWYVNSGYFPLNGDAYNTKYVQDEWNKHPAKKVLTKILSDSKDYYKFQEPLMPSLNNYKTMLADQIALVGQGKQTIDQVISTITKKTQSILDIYAKANS